jgi:hypothetical protein
MPVFLLVVCAMVVSRVGILSTVLVVRRFSMVEMTVSLVSGVVMCGMVILGPRCVWSNQHPYHGQTQRRQPSCVIRLIT